MTGRRERRCCTAHPPAWLVVAVLAVAATAQAQRPAASPAAASEAAQPVRVVCIAEAPEAFLRDEIFRDRVLARLPAALPAAGSSDAASRLRALITPLNTPLGRRFIVPVGSGFVVDPERRHVVSTWHVATACASDRSAGRQLAIVEAEGADIAAVLAERLPARTFQDAAGRPVKLVQAVCRDWQQPCGADLPRSPDDKPMTEAERRRQLDHLVAYAPDLAVLRLQTPARARPLPLALQQPLDDQMRLVARSFGPPPAGIAEPDAAARLHLVAPLSVAAVYTGPQQISVVPPAGQPEGEVHLRLHRLAASVQPGQAGAPVLRGAAVVGVLTTLLQAAGGATSVRSAEAAYAVPVTVLAVFLDLLKVPYVAAVPESPALPVAAVAPLVAPREAGPAPQDGPWWAEPQQLMLAGALALALLAAAAFFLLARRPTPAAAASAAPALPQVPQRTTTSRVNQTLLHAVAMPTSALDLDPLPTTAPAPARSLPTAHTAAPPPVGAHLRGSAGPLANFVYTLPMPNGGTTLFVGRDAQSCQVVFPPTMDEVSAVHACFIWDVHTARLSLRDLSSSGTWVNRLRVAKGRTLWLCHGDQVDLGGPESNRFTIEMAT